MGTNHFLVNYFSIFIWNRFHSQDPVVLALTLCFQAHELMIGRRKRKRQRESDPTPAPIIPSPFPPSLSTIHTSQPMRRKKGLREKDRKLLVFIFYYLRFLSHELPSKVILWRELVHGLKERAECRGQVADMKSFLCPSFTSLVMGRGRLSQIEWEWVVGPVIAFPFLLYGLLWLKTRSVRNKPLGPYPTLIRLRGVEEGKNRIITKP